jgi:carbonic anhydrase/acetyltransferase-like protein (isoleucine patch superfamily)
MLVTHDGKSPRIDPAAYIAPNAVICGDVTIGANTCVMFGAQVIAEGGAIEIGAECIVLENAVLRSTARHDLHIGDNCLIGPNAHVVGCLIEDEVFVATGASIFHAARLDRGCEVRVHGVVHVGSHVDAGETVPIGWVAVGTPARILPPDRHDDIWAIQEPLNFPLRVYGIDRAEADMVKITRRVSQALRGHADDDVET